MLINGWTSGGLRHDKDSRVAHQGRRALLVLGMHRSGTSALTGVLGKLGVDLGPDLIAGRSDNPFGFFEHREIVEINDAALSAVASSWDDPFFLPKLPRRVELELVDSLDNLLVRDFSNASTFAIKDPRVCRFPELYLAAIKRLGVIAIPIVAVRSPLEVAQSLSKRNHLDVEHVSWLWLRHTINAVTAAEMKVDNLLFYDRLIGAPETELLRLARLAGLGSDAIARHAASVRNFVSPDLRHHSEPTGQQAPPIIHNAQGAAERLFHGLRNANSDSDVAKATEMASSWLRTHTDLLVRARHDRRMILHQAETAKAVFAPKFEAYPFQYLLLRVRIKAGNVIAGKTSSSNFMKFHLRWLNREIVRATALMRDPNRVTRAVSRIQTMMFAFPR